MIPVEAWQAFGGVVAVVILLGGGALALQRLGILRSKSAPAPAKGDDDGLADRVAGVETRIAVLDERTRKHERALEGIGKLHARIDGVAETTSRIEGEISQMNRQMSLVVRHLMGERAS